jgi:Flp pilus assembly protein TadG
MTQVLRRAAACTRGAELIEFAIALPILMLLTAGIVDFAVLFQRYEVVTNAAREAARIGVLPDYQTADIQNRARTYLRAAGLTDPAPAPTVTYGTTELAPGGPSISVVTVTVQYPHNFIFLGPVAGLIGGTGPANIVLAASSSMRREIAAIP